MPIRSPIVLAAPVLAALALACVADTRGLATLSVDELAERLAGDDAPLLYDANSEKTRARFGIIPGAQLLSSYRDYDPARELPRDRSRSLVFYCHSARCGAAVEAARRALAAGHRNVAVLPDGITGWSESGRPVASPSSG